MARLPFLVLLALTLFSAAPASADVFLSGRFTLAAGEEPGEYEFTAQIPGSLASVGDPSFPQACQVASRERVTGGATAQLAYRLQCDRPLASADTISTPWPVDGATMVSSAVGTQTERTVAGTENGVVLPVDVGAQAARPLAEIATNYTQQGILHIWMGWDHLAFVLCLCLLTSGRQLLWLVTAFTAGHSISLAASFFQLVNIPVPPVEVIIAASLTFMAREALLAYRQDSSGSPMARQMTVVVLFGLLHGLGFASALDELGVAAGERVSGLLFFNLGVEVGQLAFVGLVVAIMAGLRKVSLSGAARHAALYAVGAVGCFWTFERIATFPWA